MTPCDPRDYRARAQDRAGRAGRGLGLTEEVHDGWRIRYTHGGMEPATRTGGASLRLPGETQGPGRPRSGRSPHSAYRSLRFRLLRGIFFALPMAAFLWWVICAYPYFAAAFILAAAVALSVTIVIREAAGDGRTDRPLRRVALICFLVAALLVLLMFRGGPRTYYFEVPFQPPAGVRP